MSGCEEREKCPVLAELGTGCFVHFLALSVVVIILTSMINGTVKVVEIRRFIVIIHRCHLY